METMDYNNLNNKRPGVGLFLFIFTILVGGGLVAYFLANEPEPIILGQDAFVNIYIEEQIVGIKTGEEETKNKAEKKDEKTQSTVYGVKNIYKTESIGNFKARIVLPKISIEGLELKEINQEIQNHFVGRYELFKNENAKKLENKFTYATTYKRYYNKLANGNEILSFLIYEKIIDDKNSRETMSNIYGYNIDLKTFKIIKQEETATMILGPDYSNILRTQVKKYVLDKKMIEESKYSYSITGLETFYVRDAKFHIVFNTGELVPARHKQLDIKIVK